MMKKGICPNCQEPLDVNSDKKLGVCPHCGKPYFSNDAIKSVETPLIEKEPFTETLKHETEEIEDRSLTYQQTFDLAIKKLHDSDFIQAEVSFKQAIKIQPDNHLAWLGLSQSISKNYKDSQRKKESVFALEKALNLAPTNDKSKLTAQLNSYQKSHEKFSSTHPALWSFIIFAVVWLSLFLINRFITQPLVLQYYFNQLFSSYPSLLYVFVYTPEIVLIIILYTLTQKLIFKNKDKLISRFFIIFLFHMLAFVLIDQVVGLAIIGLDSTLKALINFMFSFLLMIADFFMMYKVVAKKELFKKKEKNLVSSNVSGQSEMKLFFTYLLFYLISFALLYGSTYIPSSLDNEILLLIGSILFFIANFFLQRKYTFKTKRKFLLAFGLLLIFHAFYYVGVIEYWFEDVMYYFYDFVLHLDLNWGSDVGFITYLLMLMFMEYFYTRYLVYRKDFKVQVNEYK